MKITVLIVLISILLNYFTTFSLTINFNWKHATSNRNKRLLDVFSIRNDQLKIEAETATTSTSTTTTTTSTSTTTTTTSTSTTTTTTSTSTTTTTTSTSTTTTTTSITTSSTTISMSSISTAPFTMRTLVPQLSNLYDSPSAISLNTFFQSSGSAFGYLVSVNYPISFVSDQYSSLQIRQNGFVTIGNKAALFGRVLPVQSFSSIKFPVIAPFWTNSYTALDSDISYAVYNANQLNTANSLKTNIISDVTEFINTVPNGSNGSTLLYNPDTAIVVTWKNLKPRSTSNQNATFQIIITSSFSTQKSYLIINYERKDLTWADNSRSVLIGFTDGNKKQIQSLYSSTNGYQTPLDVFTKRGNINKIGRYVYDISFVDTDKCRQWYNKMIKTQTPSLLNYAVNTNRLVGCPLFEPQIPVRPFFVETDSYWQENVNCYKIRSRAVFWSSPQQICCYDAFRGFLTSGSNAGFLYYENGDEDFDSIIQAGINCCGKKDKTSCQRFYNIYPRNSVGNNFFGSSFGTGATQLLTFDELSYSFNGYGIYWLTKSDDGTFSIQAKTDIFNRGTVFVGVAVKGNSTSTVQLELADQYSNNPFLALYVNGNRIRNFDSNYAYNVDYPSSQQPEYTVIQNPTVGTLILLNNGVSVSLTTQSLNVNSTTKRSWLSISVTVGAVNDYRNKLKGLMGNFNGNKNDDIFARNGTILTNDKLSERNIYNFAETWRVPSDESFYATTNSGEENSLTTSFQPLFSEDLTFSDEIKQACNNILSCMIDATLTGIPGVGTNTLSQKDAQTKANEISNNKPPIINLRTTNIQVDLSDSSKWPIKIIADINDPDANKIKVFVVNNATNTVTSNCISNTLSSSTCEITYNPSNQYPKIDILASDSLGATSKLGVPIKICNCRSVDSTNTCLFNETLYYANENVQITRCACNQYYTGDFCDQLIDFCQTSLPCESFNANYAIKYTCQSLSIDERKRTNHTYYCNGICPSTGYTKDDYGFCNDIDECSIPNSCPSNAIRCDNIIGSYKCICPSGYRYTNNKCQDIDECSEGLDNCEMKCLNNNGGFTCTCYGGYIAVNSTSCKIDTNSIIAGCATKGCAQICTSDAGNVFCACNKGYSLNADGQTCSDVDECSNNNGECSDYCNNTVGSYFCTCPVGKILDEYKRTCISCPSNKYGKDCNMTCDCVNSLQCDSVKGCICITGFTGSKCDIDIDECSNVNVTYYYSTCINTPGGYYLICQSGFDFFVTTDNNCYDVDECKLGVTACPKNSICNNTNGGYNCNCYSGFNYDNTSKSCVDVNECLNSQSCPANAGCTNLPGTYKCDCNVGFIKNTTITAGLVCDDIDECTPTVIPPKCNVNENCINSIGSYNCTCKTGYTRINSTCVDINECLQPGICQTFANCFNLNGGYQCKCQDYYVENYGKCEFQINSIQTQTLDFQILFKNKRCSQITDNDTKNITDLITNQFKALNLNLNVTVSDEPCIGTDSPKLNVHVVLDKPIQPLQTSLVLMSIGRMQLDGITISVLNNNSLVPISTDPCFLYNSQNLCLNGGKCSISSNNTPICNCVTVATSSFTGEYCQNQITITTTITAIITTPDNATTSTKKETDYKPILLITGLMPLALFLLNALLLLIYFFTKRFI